MRDVSQTLKEYTRKCIDFNTFETTTTYTTSRLLYTFSWGRFNLTEVAGPDNWFAIGHSISTARTKTSEKPHSVTLELNDHGTCNGTSFLVSDGHCSACGERCASSLKGLTSASACTKAGRGRKRIKVYVWEREEDGTATAGLKHWLRPA